MKTNAHSLTHEAIVFAIACTLLDGRGILTPPPHVAAEIKASAGDSPLHVLHAKFVVRNKACVLCQAWEEEARRVGVQKETWFAPVESPLVEGHAGPTCEACVFEGGATFEAAIGMGLDAEKAKAMLLPYLPLAMLRAIEAQLAAEPPKTSVGDGRDAKLHPRIEDRDLGDGPDKAMNMPAFLLFVATMPESGLAEMRADLRPIVRRMRERADRAIALAEAAAIVQAAPVVRSRNEIILDALNVRKVVAYTDAATVVTDGTEKPGVKGKANIDMRHLFRLALGEDAVS